MEKYVNCHFGCCSRVYCNNQNLLPVGLSDKPNVDSVKLFCPCCKDEYDTDSDLDGAYFGPYFPQFFLQALRDDVRVEKPSETRLSVVGVPVDGDSQMNRSKVLHAGEV